MAVWVADGLAERLPWLGCQDSDSITASKNSCWPCYSAVCVICPYGASDGLLANLSAFMLDFAARQKMPGANLTYFVLEQLPVLPPGVYEVSATWTENRPLADWIHPRVLELTYTFYEMAPWAKYLGDDGPPFVWDERRRFLIRAELDAAFFHLYGIERADVDLVLDSFRAFKNKQPAVFEDTKKQTNGRAREQPPCPPANVMYERTQLSSDEPAASTVNAAQAVGVTTRGRMPVSLESRTWTASGRTAISTQLPPPLPL
jgi:hypothetical protein